MPAVALESVLRRDRLIVAASLIVVTVLAWAYVLWLAANGMADMPANMASGAMAMAAPALKPWTGTDFAFMFAMWAVMMVGMMTPSAAPMILLYARVGRHAAAQGKPLAATGWFAGGYLLMWMAFSLLATAAQWALTDAALLSPMMVVGSAALGGIVLVAAGLYQWTSLKDACLAHCRAPLSFIQQHGGFRRDAWGSLVIGARHGAYCVGCCWALMALLFVGGIMNVLWIAALTALVLIEKVIPAGRLISRGAGVVIFATGVYLIAGAVG